MNGNSNAILGSCQIPTYEPRNVGVVLVMKACTHYRPGYQLLTVHVFGQSAQQKLSEGKIIPHTMLSINRPW